MKFLLPLHKERTNCCFLGFWKHFSCINQELLKAPHMFELIASKDKEGQSEFKCRRRERKASSFVSTFTHWYNENNDIASVALWECPQAKWWCRWPSIYIKKLHLTEQEAKGSCQNKVSWLCNLLTSCAIWVQTLNSRHARTACAPQCVNVSVHVCVPASLWPVNTIAGPGW